MANFSNILRGIQDAVAKAADAATEGSKRVGSAANEAYEAIAPTLNDVTKNVGEFAGQAYATVEEKTSEAAEYLKEQAQNLGGNAIDALSLDDIGRKIASLGLPAITFAVAASIAGGMGLAGGAVVTTALAMLGGPFGMIGGLVALGVLTIIADAVGKYGIEAVLLSAFAARREQGISTEQIYSEIDGLWLSGELKRKLKDNLKIPE